MKKVTLVNKDYQLEKFSKQVQREYYKNTEDAYLVLKTASGHSCFVPRPPLPLWIIKKSPHNFKLKKTKSLLIFRSYTTNTVITLNDMLYPYMIKQLENYHVVKIQKEEIEKSNLP